MDQADRELMDQLAKGPFEPGGFDERLHQRIVDRITGRTARSRPRQTAVWPWPMAALTTLAIVLTAVWLMHHQPQAELLSGHAYTPAAGMASPAPSAAAPVAVEPLKKYALLIGLRADDPGRATAASRYRTVLVADERRPQELQLIANIPGLYMPYGQNFWQIADSESPDHRQALHAVQVTGRKANAGQPERDLSAHVPDYVLSERVSYAGNEYLSIQATVTGEQGDAVERWRIKHIGQMNEKPDDPLAEPYTRLQEVLPEAEAGQGQTSEWSIYRNPGKWVSELYDPVTGKGRMLASLPDNVIHNDALLLPWETIERIEPGARDAFTYGNVLGVVTDNAILVRTMKDGAAMAAPVQIPLEAGESVVMIQWAQNDKIDYVDKWIQDFRGLSGSNP